MDASPVAAERSVPNKPMAPQPIAGARPMPLPRPSTPQPRAPQPVVQQPMKTSAPIRPVPSSRDLQSSPGGSSLPTPIPARPAVMDGTAETSINDSVKGDQVEEMIMEIISERTGFPRETLDRDLRLLDDLNMDSIKAATSLPRPQGSWGLWGPLIRPAWPMPRLEMWSMQCAKLRAAKSSQGLGRRWCRPTTPRWELRGPRVLNPSRRRVPKSGHHQI